MPVSFPHFVTLATCRAAAEEEEEKRPGSSILDAEKKAKEAKKQRGVESGKEDKEQSLPEQEPPVRFSACQGWCSALMLNRNATSRENPLAAVEQENRSSIELSPSQPAPEEIQAESPQQQDPENTTTDETNDEDFTTFDEYLKKAADAVVESSKYNSPRKAATMRQTLLGVHSLVLLRIQGLAEQQQGFDETEASIALETVNVLLTGAMGRFEAQAKKAPAALATQSTIQHLLLLLHSSAGTVDFEQYREPWTKLLKKPISPKLRKLGVPVSTLQLLKFHLQVAVTAFPDVQAKGKAIKAGMKLLGGAAKFVLTSDPRGVVQGGAQLVGHAFDKMKRIYAEYYSRLLHYFTLRRYQAELLTLEEVGPTYPLSCLT